VEETEILVEQPLPQGDLVCDHAGRVINEFSPRCSHLNDVLQERHHDPGVKVGLQHSPSSSALLSSLELSDTKKIGPSVRARLATAAYFC
jgi:hypothetical protein